MPTIRDPGLRSAVDSIKAQHQTAPQQKADAELVNQLLARLGDRAGVSAASVAAKLGGGQLLPQEKLALVQKGMTAGERAALKTILADPEITDALDATSLNFLKAVAGLEPLAATDGVGGTRRTDTLTNPPPPAAVAAVAKLEQLVKSGRLEAYYDAAIGATTNPALKAEAMELFNNLPKITSATKAEEMVALGLWTTAPRGLEQLEKSARYLPGRQVLVKTRVNTDLTTKLDFKPIMSVKVREDSQNEYFQKVKKDPNGRWSNGQGERFSPDGPEKSLAKADLASFLSYDPDGVEAVTYRATIKGEEGDNFLIAVDGKDEPISVPKAEIFKLNQPMELDGDSVSVCSKRADFNDPFTKAKVCEAAIKMDEHVGKLDFTKARTAPPSGPSSFYGSSRTEAMVDLQKKCVQTIHDCIDMTYHNDRAPGRKGGSNVGRQAIRGAGVCFEQSGVMAGLTVPFHRMLGIDMRSTNGGNYRNVTNNGNPFRSGGHTWLQLTFRPNMTMTVTDRTWNQCNFSMDKAYSFFGDRYPGGTGYGVKIAEVKPTDVNCSGDVSIATFERQFGRPGDGRENHQ